MLVDGAAGRGGTVPVMGSARTPHYAPKAKRVVQVFCCGGVSHIDTFDYQPALERWDGKTLEGKGENFTTYGSTIAHGGVDDTADWY